MKKISILAVALLVAGSMFAAGPVSTLNASRLFVQPSASPFLSGGPATINNDDSCEIAATPAATLLLPYFEVDFASPNTSAVNTLFTITNTSKIPQIAHITLWTDWSFPILDFNIFLTGYDVQGISLYDIISRGQIPKTGYKISPVGSLSVDSSKGTGNPNWNLSAVQDAVTGCASLPGPIPSSLLAAIQSALTTGSYTGCTKAIGGTHANAVGYLTVDVVDKCSQKLPTDAAFYTDDILFDNVLIGDYQRIDPRTSATAKGFAAGNPMVHIRAIPEGGNNRNTRTNFPYTFYDRYTPTANRQADRRQPLPSVWAARFIDKASASLDQLFDTDFAIWREGLVRDNGTAPTCSTTLYSNNADIPVTRLVRFDEHENPTLPSGCQISPCPEEAEFAFPETGLHSVANDSLFPADFTGTTDDGGWMYMNLGNGGSSAYSDDREMSSNWVVIEMTAEGRYGVDFDAAYLGNGCSPNPGSTAEIGPLANSN